jgi:putative Mn2+ efflux pump MntP
VGFGIPSKVIASVFALSAFAVAVVAGLAGGNAADRVLMVAIGSMFLCHVVGMVVGAVGEWVVNEHVKARIAATPHGGKMSSSGGETPQSVKATGG